MAIALGSTVTGTVTTGNTVTVTSWTPGSNELVLVSVYITNEAITPTVAGNGLTFVNHGDVTNVQNVGRLVVFRAMGASPSTGSITVTITGNAGPCGVIATRFSGTDTSGTNGSGACEAVATAAGPGTDDNDALLAVTTVTANAWAFAAAGYRNRTFTVPGGQTIIHDDLLTGGTAGQEANSSQWYIGPVATPASTTLGALNDLSAATDWVMVAVSIKPAAAGTTITPGIFAIVWTGFAPTVTASDHKTVTPAAFTVAWTGFAPTVTATDHKVITPSPFTLAWTGLAPTVNVTDHKTVTPAPFALTWTGLAPTVTAGGGTAITPDPFTLTWTGFAPSLAITDHKTVTPAPFAVAWTGLAPTVTGGAGQTITPAPFAIAWTGLAPSLAITDHKTVTPDPFDLIWTGYVPLVVTGLPEPSRLETPIGTSHGRPVTVVPYG